MGHGVDAHQGLQEVVARPRVEVAPRLPGGLRSVDLLDEVLGEDLVVLTSLDQGKSQQEERQVELHLSLSRSTNLSLGWCSTFTHF